MLLFLSPPWCSLSQIHVPTLRRHCCIQVATSSSKSCDSSALCRKSTSLWLLSTQLPLNAFTFLLLSTLLRHGPLTLNNPHAPISIIPFDPTGLESPTGKHHRRVSFYFTMRTNILYEGITPKSTSVSRSIWGVAWRGCFNVISKSNCQSITISLQPRL